MVRDHRPRISPESGVVVSLVLVACDHVLIWWELMCMHGAERGSEA